MQAIDKYIDAVGQSVSMPRIVPQLMLLLQRSDVESGRVVKLISLDPGLMSSVIRMCNTAYFAAGTLTSDLQEAVTRLGFQQVYQLVAAASGARLFSKPQKGYGIEHGELWRHSVAAAVVAQIIAKRVGESESQAFTATLLHDVGKVILTEPLEATFGELWRNPEANQRSVLDKEKKLLSVQHAEVGAQLLKRWGFSPGIVSAVWFHHSPSGAASHQRLASCIYLGNLVAHLMGNGFGHHALGFDGRKEVLTILNLEPAAIPQLIMEAFEQRHLVEALVGVE